jgi:hypothetical protein
MVEISFWHPGDEKVRVIYTSDDLDNVSACIRHVNEGIEKYASFSHPTGEGKVYIPSSVVRECVVIVTAVVDKPAKGVLL